MKLPGPADQRSDDSKTIRLLEGGAALFAYQAVTTLWGRGMIAAARC